MKTIAQKWLEKKAQRSYNYDEQGPPGDTENEWEDDEDEVEASEEISFIIENPAGQSAEEYGRGMLEALAGISAGTFGTFKVKQGGSEEGGYYSTLVLSPSK